MKSYRYRTKAFTLIELLLVITIISILASVIVPGFFGRSEKARITAVKQTITGTFSIAIDLYEQDTGKYPDNSTGLEALIQNNETNWQGPYLKAAAIPADPWGNQYRYCYPSEITGKDYLYDIVSAGPDGKFGNDDDINNHNI